MRDTRFLFSPSVSLRLQRFFRPVATRDGTVISPRLILESVTVVTHQRDHIPRTAISSCSCEGAFWLLGVERWAHTFEVAGGIHDERIDWNWGKSRWWRALAGNRRFPGRGRCVFCAVVLVAAVMAGLSRRHVGCGAMALDCGRALGAWFRRGTALRLGLWMDRTRDAGANCSAEEAGGGGVLPVREEPHVPGVHRGMGRAMGGLWNCEPGRDRGGVRDCAGCGFVCAVVRGADAPKNVRRGL